MTQQDTAASTRSKTWTLTLDITEEGMDSTAVDATLDTGNKTLVSHTSAHRNPNDPPAPDIGDEYAAGRALLDLGKQLLRAGTDEAAANAQDAEF
jgi:hypothetical protein